MRIVTWGSPSGNSISICRECQKRLEAVGQWPRDGRGEEYCQVIFGERYGSHCDVHPCSLTPSQESDLNTYEGDR